MNDCLFYEWDSPEGMPLTEPTIPFWGTHAFPEGTPMEPGVPLLPKGYLWQATLPVGRQVEHLSIAFLKNAKSKKFIFTDQANKHLD